jgi:hypothetical protein
MLSHRRPSGSPADSPPSEAWSESRWRANPGLDGRPASRRASARMRSALSVRRLSLAWRCAYDGAGAAGSDRDDLHVVHRAVPHREWKRPIVELRAAPLALRQSTPHELTRTSKPNGAAQILPRARGAKKSPAAAPLGGSILGSAARGPWTRPPPQGHSVGTPGVLEWLRPKGAQRKGAQAARKRSTVVNWWRVCMKGPRSRCGLRAVTAHAHRTSSLTERRTGPPTYLASTVNTVPSPPCLSTTVPSPPCLSTTVLGLPREPTVRRPTCRPAR